MIITQPINGTSDISKKDIVIVNADNKKYEIVQSFRFVAALMVVILHSTFYIAEHLKSGFLRYYEGYNGVGLFFTISGFVMILSSQSLKKSHDGWKTFSVKRIIRIVPIYWIVTTWKLLLLLISASFILSHLHLDFIYILKSYFFIPAVKADREIQPLYGVGWTLNFEMFFYFLFAIALYFRIKPILFLSLIFIPLSIISFYKTSHWPDISFYANILVLNFLYGMIAAQLILNKLKLPKILAYSMILIGLIYLFSPGMHFKTDSYAPNGIIKGVVTFLIVYSGASIENKIRAKIPKWLIYMGGASYSLYLIHPSIVPGAVIILARLNINLPWVSLGFAVAIAISIAIVFYRFCERPITFFLSNMTKK